jgi:hypothetical protein
MMRVTQGWISTIEKLQHLIDTNALEVPTLHNFLKEFPWVLDPRWSLVDDEVTYSELLRNQFPEGENVPEEDRRIDFLCVKESTNLIVVEIKRPESKASIKELEQVEEYVNFMRDYVRNTTDPDLRHRDVVGYLLCGDLVNTWNVRGRRDNLASAGIFIRRYKDLLRMVRTNHDEFLVRYDRLRKAKTRESQSQIATGVPAVIAVGTRPAARKAPMKARGGKTKAGKQGDGKAKPRSRRSR